jgi:ParB family chromosome partitioning protein
MATRKALGRGLSALLGGDETTTAASVKGHIIQIPLDRIRPSVNQTRVTFDKDTLDEMAESIKRLGLINPVVVH